MLFSVAGDKRQGAVEKKWKSQGLKIKGRFRNSQKDQEVCRYETAKKEATQLPRKNNDVRYVESLQNMGSSRLRKSWVVVVEQLELPRSRGGGRIWKDGDALERSSSAASKGKIHWKEPWQILHSGEAWEVYRRDAECTQKVKRVFSSGRRGRWGGCKSRWWQWGRAEQVPILKLQPHTTYYRLFWLFLLPPLFPFIFKKWKIQLLHSPQKGRHHPTW